MKRWNWYLGLVLLAIFLITGQYLRRVEIPLDQPEGLFRMMLRANHMYVLYVSIGNLLISRSRFRSKTFKQISRSLFLLSGIAVIFAFRLETDGDLEHRTFSFITALSAFIGIGIFIIDQFELFDKKASDFS